MLFVPDSCSGIEGVNSDDNSLSMLQVAKGLDAQKYS